MAYARAVNDNKDRRGMPNTPWKEGDDPLMNRYNSFYAEAAVAEYLGIPWNMIILDAGDGKVDLTIPSGCEVGDTIQVKFRSKRGWDLATSGLDFHNELKADLYILAWPGLEEGVTLVGWATKQRFIHRIIAREPVRMLGKKYELRPDELLPMGELKEMVGANVG